MAVNSELNHAMEMQARSFTGTISHSGLFPPCGNMATWISSWNFHPTTSKGSPFLMRWRRVLPRPPAQMPRRPLQGLRHPALALPEETGVRSSCRTSAQRSRNSQQCPPSPSPKGQPSGEKEEIKIQELKLFKSASFELCNGQVCATV